MGFGQYDSGGGARVAMRAGVYHTIIKKADVKRGQGGKIVTDPKSGKAKFELIVDVHGPRHIGEELKRTMPVAFGANSETGQYAAFARFIEAATGIPCGDARQKDVEEADLLRRDLWVMVKHENGYNNIVDFVEPEEEPADTRPPYKRVEDDEIRSQQQANAQTRPLTAAQSQATSISSGKQRQIEALAHAKRVSDTQLADLIGKLTNGRTRFVGQLDLREAEAIISALKEVA